MIPKVKTLNPKSQKPIQHQISANFLAQIFKNTGTSLKPYKRLPRLAHLDLQRDAEQVDPQRKHNF